MNDHEILHIVEGLGEKFNNLSTMTKLFSLKKSN